MGIRKLGRQVFPGISSRLIVSFSLISAGMVFVIGWMYLQGLPFTSYEGRIEEQREKTFTGLTLVADRKKEELLRWIDERRGDTHVTAGNASVASGTVHLRQRVNELTEADEPELWSLLSRDETYLDLVGNLRTIRDTYGYDDNIQIADVETGIVFVSTDNSTLGADLSGEPCLINAFLTPLVLISDIPARSEDQQPALHFSHLVSDGQGGAAGVLLMKVDVEDIIKSILQADPFLGESGEALLVNQSRKILTPLKYPLADGTVAKPLQYTITALPATLASRGEEGIIETHDYRGEKVLSAYRHISLSEDLDWGMVVKIDYAALLAPIRLEINNTLIVGSVSVVILMMLTIPVTRSITNPIIVLKATAERIAEGDLSARAKISSSYEVRTLARAFNQMADSLVKAKTGLEEEVRERTKDLEERERYYRSILSYLHEDIMVIGKDYIITDINNSFLITTGKTREDVIGKH
ncbi:MAG: HAMP domain-containing protein, partial [Spirochaetales bacterium]|nr:HAMP domain-containing protein [Spirochaetales bacterium]